MHCANPMCRQLVVRFHEYELVRGPHPIVDEVLLAAWTVYPRRSNRAIDPLIGDEYRTDYEEAASILDLSPRMSSVLSRRILGDLLEHHAKLEYNSLKKQIDEFIADTARPYELREDLHYLREIGDFSSHTQTNDRGEIINVTRDEAEWTLDIVDRLFDYFIVSPEKSRKLREGIAEKIKEAGRKEIPPLPDAPGGDT
jgi:hypothetical protein